MIVSVRANDHRFKTVRFRPGFNAIIAEKASSSSAGQTRNGTGKTTLLNIIHFCLGSQVNKNSIFTNKEIKNWEFSLELYLNEQLYFIKRPLKNTDQVHVTTKQLNEPEMLDYLNSDKLMNYRLNGYEIFDLKEFRKWLGKLFFGLPLEDESTKVSFRMLISYFIRIGGESFIDAFRTASTKNAWQQQVCNAFLLGLNEEIPAKLYELEAKKSDIKSLKKVLKEGTFPNIFLSAANLRTQIAIQQEEVKIMKENLDNFRVLPEYKKIEENIDQLTSQVKKLMRENSTNKRLVQNYEESFTQHQVTIDGEYIHQMYENVGIELGLKPKRQLEEVKEFHNQIIANRADFIADEVKRLKSDIFEKDKLIQLLSDEKSKKMEILETHGALDDYNKIQDSYSEAYSKLNKLKDDYDKLSRAEREEVYIKIEIEEQNSEAQKEIHLKQELISDAARKFNQNSQYLYNEPGYLVIGNNKGRFSYKIEIQRSKSEGIGKMKIYCYDLALMQLSRGRKPFINFLIHDSTLFDGVDERQRAKAIELAQKESADRGFQYICLLNSDMIPTDEFKDSFDFDQYVRLILTDEDDTSGLLGLQIK